MRANGLALPLSNDSLMGFANSERIPRAAFPAVALSVLVNVGPLSAVHAAAAMLGLVVVEAGRVARGRAGLRPCLLRTPTRHPSYGRQ